MLYNCSSHVAMTWPPLGKLWSPFGIKIIFIFIFKAPPYFSHFVSSLFMACALPASRSLMFPCAAVYSPFRPSVPIIFSLNLNNILFFSHPLALSSRLMFPSAFYCWLIPDLLTDLLPQTVMCQPMKIIYLLERMTKKIYG